VGLIRAYANIAEDLDAAGYDTASQKRIKDLLDHYVKLRETIRNASG
jgi:type I restriction enzyme R subunit